MARECVVFASAPHVASVIVRSGVAQPASKSKSAAIPSINGMLIDSEDGRYAAIVMDVPTTEDLWMMHSIIFANFALIITRPTFADLTAIRHTLTLLLTGLKSEKRLAN